MRRRRRPPSPSRGREPSRRHRTPRPRPGAPRVRQRRRRLALILAFVSGLTSLGYQVVWNRLLGAGTGSSTYVFTIILALFLVGIALGARPARRPPAAGAVDDRC